MNIFLTGATGFLGEYLLQQLLARGHRVWALYRNEAKKEKTEQFLARQDLFPHPGLNWVKGDVIALDQSWPLWEKELPSLEKVNHILHNAASLRFKSNAEGEPRRTNLEGSKALWRLTRQRPMQVHLISTAYVCGLIPEGTLYEVNHPRGQFASAYDESKWEAEQIWTGQATILRPGVIVGDSRTGRCSSFTGWYIIAKGGYLMDQFLKAAPEYDRQDLQIQVPMNPQATLNLIPVDYVAEAVVRLIENPAHFNRIFHLTHPQPPTHEWSHQVLCRRFQLGGIRFVDPGQTVSKPNDPIKQMIWDQVHRMYAYFNNNPAFDRRHTDQALPDLPLPTINETLINKLLDYAIAQDWGQKKG
ncbi:MAG: SDR family oxidoreductase [Thermodesulfobacteriota bacterium]